MRAVGMHRVGKITLDAETFRALASSTRLTVLKALDERRKTLTELARDLQLNKATVHEHMQLLTAAGLVRKRDDEGRKGTYYELPRTAHPAPRGHDDLQPPPQPLRRRGGRRHRHARPRPRLVARRAPHPRR